MQGTIIKCKDLKMFVIKVSKKEAEYKFIDDSCSGKGDCMGPVLDSIDEFIRANFEDKNKKMSFDIFAVVPENGKYAVLYGCSTSEFNPSNMGHMEKAAVLTAKSDKVRWVNVNKPECSDVHYEREEKDSYWFKLPYLGMILDIPFSEGEIYQSDTDYYVRTSKIGMCEFLEECEEPRKVYKVISAEEFLSKAIG